MTSKYTIEQIVGKVHRLIKKYDETDPFRLVKAMGLILVLQPMGTDAGCVKGFFMRHNRINAIVINSSLPRIMQRIVLAHEIGHSVLHSKKGTFATFHETSLFSGYDFSEYEANLFASELLLSDETVMDAMQQEQCFSQISSELLVPPEILNYKLRIMKQKGYQTPDTDVVQSNFLKNFEKDAVQGGDFSW